MIHILIPQMTSRLEYTLDLVFKDLLQADFKYYTEERDFQNLEGPKIAYGADNHIADAVNVPAGTLLFETGIRNHLKVEMKEGELPFLFPMESNDLNYDIFSAIFFLVTRYEEYQPHETDRHGRYKYHQSVLHQFMLMDRPLINEYINLFKRMLEVRFDMQLKGITYKYIPTYDIDIAYAYKGRGLKRTLGGAVRSVLKGDIVSVVDRAKTLSGMSHDPFDTFDALEEINKKYKLSPIYFFQVGGDSSVDKSIDTRFSYFKELIKRTSSLHKVGIHPSYSSNTNAEVVKEEIENLEKICGRKIIRSRQHFLKLKIPDTYENLINFGIEEDYSMAYPDKPGFRAGIAAPYHFYNIVKEESTSLKIFPFQVMDTTFNSYMGADPQEAEEVSRKIAEKISQSGGTFITLWHNNSLSNYQEWKGWQHLYEKVVSIAKEQG